MNDGMSRKVLQNLLLTFTFDMKPEKIMFLGLLREDLNKDERVFLVATALSAAGKFERSRKLWEQLAKSEDAMISVCAWHSVETSGELLELYRSSKEYYSSRFNITEDSIEHLAEETIRAFTSHEEVTDYAAEQDEKLFAILTLVLSAETNEDASTAVRIMKMTLESRKRVTENPLPALTCLNRLGEVFA